MLTSAPIHIDPNDIVLIRVTYDDISVQDVKRMFDFFQTYYPNNKCLCIPDSVSLKTCSIEDLKQIKKELDNLIAEVL